MVSDFAQKTKDLIDNLKGTCASYGLGNDGNESKIITQVFLYKFMNDKFGYDLKKIDERFSGKESWETVAGEMPDSIFNKIVMKINPNTAKLKKEHLISYLYNKQNTTNFSKLFDSTLIDISQSNAGIFSVSTASNAKITLFDELSLFVADPSQRDSFCKAIVNQLVNFSFEEIFVQKFDFFSTIFEYLIKDYNKDGGGKYAEYYTPHAVSKIMAKILVDKPQKSVTVYDPSAGSGTLLMNVSHEIGEKNCTIYSQDISQKSSGMLRLNLILNDLVHSIQNIVQGNTLLQPAFNDRKFDFVVSNPPFKLDFSDIRSELEVPRNAQRFFAGIPKAPDKQKDLMAIYLLFLQHIIFSLNSTGKAAVVVPTGFITSTGAIETTIRKFLVEKGYISGAVLMPSNIFANTGTNVSVLFLDKSANSGAIYLLDASRLGTKVKEGKNQKTLLSEDEENLIIDTFRSRIDVENFGILVDSKKILEDKRYSFNIGNYAKTWDLDPDKAIDDEKVSYGERIQRNKMEIAKISKENISLLDKFKTNLESIGILELDGNIQDTVYLESIGLEVFKNWFVNYEVTKAQVEKTLLPNFKKEHLAKFPNSFHQSKGHDLPHGWKICTIEELGRVSTGKTPSTEVDEFWGDDYPFVTIPDMSDNPFLLTTSRGISEEGAVSLGKSKRLPSGSTLVSCIATPGLVSYVIEDCFSNQQINAVIPNKDVSPIWLYFRLLSMVNQIKQMSGDGSVFSNLNKENFSGIETVKADPQSIALFDEIFSPCFELIFNIVRQRKIAEFNLRLLKREVFTKRVIISAKNLDS